MSVVVSKDGSVAVVTVDNPPINALSQAVRQGMMAAFEATEDDHDVEVVVLRCAGRTFIAGADIREFNMPPQQPHLPDVINLLEQARKPWVAVLHGTVLGGGLEVALGCHYRIADCATFMGLPEVNLGLIPGAGGTVRLPRLVAPDVALEMVAGGKPVDAKRAYDVGLIDKLVESDLSEASLAFAREVASKPLPVPLSARQVQTVGGEADIKAQMIDIRARARGKNAPLAAIEAITDSINFPAKTALEKERERFLSLKADPQSEALRYIFFAERSATRLPHLKTVMAQTPERVGVIGGGTMGVGIAATCLLHGLDVTLIERDDGALRKGIQALAQLLDGSQARGVISVQRRAELERRLEGSLDYGALATSDLVIEAVFEDMALKREVFAQLDKVVRADAVLATNTSYLDVAEIARATQNPARVIGLHFFSPAHVMKLLEVVVPGGASDEVVATGFAFARQLKKIAVPAGNCDGFIGNRIMAAYRREADYMLEDGALPHEIDVAMTNFGFPMGIFAMQDLAGLDIAWAMRKRRAASRPASERYVDIADKLCEEGRLGRKATKGWYDYSTSKAGQVDPEVTQLILDEARRKGITRCVLHDSQIMERILTTMQTEAQALIAEGIAQSPEAVDVVMVNGYGFPRWRGGPMYMSSELSRD